MRKAEISINFIAVVAMTLIAIMIIIGYTAKELPISQKIYCKTVGLITQRDLSSIADDDPCKAYLKLQASDVPTVDSDVDILEEVVQHVMDCWSRSNSGQISQSFLCEEVILPADYVFEGQVGEKEITDEIIDRQLCHLIENSDFGCGEEDNLVVGTIGFSTNVLIEYDGESRQVKVDAP